MVPLKDEYEELEENDRRRNGAMSDLMTSQGKRYNSGGNGKLNVDKLVLPYDQNRVILKTPVNGVDYINANWITRINKERVYEELIYNDYLPYAKINFILTQDPTVDSEAHYLRMIFEQEMISCDIGCV